MWQPASVGSSQLLFKVLISTIEIVGFSDIAGRVQMPHPSIYREESSVERNVLLEDASQVA